MSVLKKRKWECKKFSRHVIGTSYSWICAPHVEIHAEKETDNCVRPSSNESYSIYLPYERFCLGNLAHRRTTARLCALFEVYSGERVWKAIRDRLWWLSYLSRVDHVRKIRDRKQRTDIWMYPFVNRNIKNWNQLPAEALRSFPFKPKLF
jgi:hypothetical protein